MRSLLRFAVVAIAVAASTHPAAAADATPAQAAATAYGQGQAYERLFQDVKLAPATCAVVLERQRCNADLDTNLAIRPADAFDGDIRKWFATGDIALQAKNWNSSYIPESSWKSDPVFAWWYTGGIVSIAASMPQGADVDTYLSSIGQMVDEHVSLAPGGEAAWAFPGSTSYERMAALQSKFEAVFPVQAYPAPRFGPGAIAYAQLGVYVSTLQELADNAMALSRPESRAFAAAVLAKLERAHAQFADGLSAAPLQALIDQPILAEPEWIDAHWRQPLSKQIDTKWPQTPRYALALGASVAQLAYNAAVIKDADWDAQTRSTTSSIPPLPGAPSKTRADLAVLLQIPPVVKGGKWEDINAAATTVTLDIVNGV